MFHARHGHRDDLPEMQQPDQMPGTTRRLLRRGEFTSKQDLAEKITNFIEVYDDTARPFRWTADPQSRMINPRRIYAVLHWRRTHRAP